jgi:hypothetical protein
LLKRASIFAATILAAVIATAAEAQQRPRTAAPRTTIDCDQRGCSDQANPSPARASRTRTRESAATDPNGNTIVIGGRPAGCPHQYCGCEASRYVFGEVRPELNLASNWIKNFARTSPASGMVAARASHVMVLMQQVDGDNWLVHDGNSGGGLTRRHVRSISGYVIVDPHATRTAESPSSQQLHAAHGLAHTPDDSPPTQSVL